MSNEFESVQHLEQQAHLLSSILDASNDPITADVQARRLTEEKLDAASQLIRRLMESSQTPLVTISPDGKITDLNEATTQVTGFSREEMIGTSFSKYFTEPQRAWEGYLEVVAKGSVSDYLLTIRHKDGRFTDILYNASIYRNTRGNVLGVLVSARNVTDRKSAFQIKHSQTALINMLDDIAAERVKVEQARAVAEVANRELESVAYSVAHDLRAPLRAMDGFSQALLEEYSNKLDQQGQDYLQRIRRSSQLMAQLIDDLLGLSRVIRSEINKEKVHLSDMAEGICLELKRSPPEREVEFKIEPGLLVEADTRLLKIALENLLGNAWKYTSRRKNATIEMGSTRINNQVTFFIRDNGAGFNMAYANKLFQPFSRLHTQKEFPGTGIGLATVVRIIHRHHGKIWSDAKVGEGTTFYFTLGGTTLDS